MDARTESRRRIFILVGPKGSGKTHIGALVRDRLGIPFLRVEDIALRVKRDRTYDDQEYVSEVFKEIERAAREAAAEAGSLVFESTAAAAAFDGLVERLGRDHEVILIQVRADPERCVTRVRSRDRALHIDVSDDQVRAINAIAARRSLPFRGAIDNDDASEEAILAAFRAAAGDLPG